MDFSWTSDETDDEFARRIARELEALFSRDDLQALARAHRERRAQRYEFTDRDRRWLRGLRIAPE